VLLGVLSCLQEREGLRGLEGLEATWRRRGTSPNAVPQQYWTWPESAQPTCAQQLVYARAGSGRRKRLCARGPQVEPAAWRGPAFGGGPRLRRGRLFLLCPPAE
jgi:hypothetical protein